MTYNIYKEKEVSDETVIQEIEEVLSQKFVLYGYRKVTAVLRRRSYLINSKQKGLQADERRRAFA